MLSFKIEAKPNKILRLTFINFLSVGPFYRLQCVLDGCMGADRGVIPAICLVRPTHTHTHTAWATPPSEDQTWAADWATRPCLANNLMAMEHRADTRIYGYHMQIPGNRYCNLVQTSASQLALIVCLSANNS